MDLSGWNCDLVFTSRPLIDAMLWIGIVDLGCRFEVCLGFTLKVETLC